MLARPRKETKPVNLNLIREEKSLLNNRSTYLDGLTFKIPAHSGDGSTCQEKNIDIC